jgi:hypothetical protein
MLSVEGACCDGEDTIDTFMSGAHYSSLFTNTTRGAFIEK